MSRMFAAVLLLMVLAGARGYAQEAPAGQQPAGQPPAAPAAPAPAQTPAQESPDDESTSRHKVKAHDYRNWTVNAGGGVNLPSGTTKTFVKGGGLTASGGVARNFNKYFGFRLDGLWADLPLRTSALQLAQAPGASSHVYGLTLSPIFNIPVNKQWSGYILVGPGYFHRSGELDSSTAVPGSACNAFWSWWGTCLNGSLPVNGKFLNASQNEFGFTFGGGVARKIRPNLEVYGEYRYVHAKHNNITTDLSPITIGVRW